jgi:zinc transport system permease protein
VLAALLAALVKGLLARAGASAYALMMLLAWGGGVLLVANHPLAEQAGHALFDGQLYFTGEAHLLVTALAAVVVLPALAWLSRPLLLARFFRSSTGRGGRTSGPGCCSSICSPGWWWRWRRSASG